MEELPEKDTPRARPEDRDPGTEDAPAPTSPEQSTSEQAQEGENLAATAQTGPEKPQAESTPPDEGPVTEHAAGHNLPGSTERAGETLGNATASTDTSPQGEQAQANAEESVAETTPPEPQPVPAAQPEHVESEIALQQEGAPAENPEAAAQPQSAAVPAAGPQAQPESTEGAAATEEETPAPVDEVELTPSGAVKIPGAEAESPVAASQEERPKKAPARAEKPTGPRLAELREGQVVEGTVTRIEKYGAFVNLGLVEHRDGLIHISELAPHRVRRVEDVVQVGSPVRARVVSVDLGRGRVALSLNDVDEGIAKEATAAPSEPTLTSMAMAFQEAQSRRRDEQQREAQERDKGSKKKREQEELMRRLRENNA